MKYFPPCSASSMLHICSIAGIDGTLAAVWGRGGGKVQGPEVSLGKPYAKNTDRVGHTDTAAMGRGKKGGSVRPPVSLGKQYAENSNRRAHRYSSCSNNTRCPYPILHGQN